MMTCCYECCHIYESKDIAPCPKCGWMGKHIPEPVVTDLNGESTSEIFHPKINFEGH